jgi:raffinose/stachyose/melibiose transport system permease protein
MPIIIVNLVLLVKGGFTTFDYPYALTGGGPARATEVIAISIVNDAFTNMRFAIANAEAGVLFVIIAVISVVQINLSRKRGV